ncbi:SPOR domain-containing protein [uncultured Treponema sp.]|uniref:SPOR domain-containing protein n=1 Tax=uncultured Treponema sp. TaxID=162155 RepID=UPI0025D36128|nr:SPOR domain-containing protein [uncultured Treponema sp.]
MEQKKTLWIVAASGIFLLVVVGAALILYSPSLQQKSAVQAGFDPTSGWISSTKSNANTPADNGLAFNTVTPPAPEQGSFTSLAPSPFATDNNFGKPESQSNFDSATPIHTDKVTVISDNATVYSTATTTIDLNSLKASSNSGIVAKNEKTASQLSTNTARSPFESQPSYEEASPIAENYYAPAPVAKVAPKTAAPKPAATKKAAPAKSTATASTKPTKAQTATKVASAAKKAPDSFWVQAAAYSSKRNADEARSTLESNKIPSEVFTFTDSNGKTFYRVRVGPYITKSEAEYWQTRISMIDKFASSKSVIVNTAVN